MGFWERVTGRTTNDSTSAPAEAESSKSMTPEAKSPEPARSEPVTPVAAGGNAQIAAEPSGPSESFIEHEVQLGDQIDAIAAHHQVSAQALIEANGLTHPERIYPGMQLRVPAS